MAKLETVAKLLGWQITMYGVRRMERGGAFDAALPAYDTDANASRELLAYVKAKGRECEFIDALQPMLDTCPQSNPAYWMFAILNATPQQIYAAFCATFGIGPMIEDNAAFITAAPSDLPTILKRLANERAKLAIAVDAMGRAATELSREVPPQYAGTDREGLPIEVEHSSVEMACGMASMDLATALARINELEKQHGKT